MESTIRQKFKKYTKDGSLSSKEVRKIVSKAGGSITDAEAQRLLLQFAGKDRRMNEDEFTYALMRYLKQGPFDPHTARAQLASYYAGACSDGMVETKEVQGAVTSFGVPCDIPTATSLIQQIAGPEKRINQQKFVETIYFFLCSKKNVTPVPPAGSPPSAPGYGAPPPVYGHPGYPPPGYGPPGPGSAPAGYPPPGYGPPGYGPPGSSPAPTGYGQPTPAYGQPAPGYGAPAPGYGAPAPGYGPPAGYGTPGYPPPPPSDPSIPPGAITSGPAATHPNPAVAAYLRAFYVAAAADGAIDANEVIRACHESRVGCDMAGASQLLQIVAAPDGKITQDKFVYHIGVYITRNQR